LAYYGCYNRYTIRIYFDC